MSEDAKTKPLITKAALQKRIDEAYAELQRALGSIDTVSMTKTLGEAGWTVKDILTHIAGWEQILVRFHIGGEPFNEVIEMQGAQYRITPYDEVNEHIFKHYQGISMDEAQALLKETHERVLAALDAFTEEELHRPHPLLSTGETASVTWIDYIAANTYEHYEEHSADL